MRSLEDSELPDDPTPAVQQTGSKYSRLSAGMKRFLRRFLNTKGLLNLSGSCSSGDGRIV